MDKIKWNRKKNKKKLEKVQVQNQFWQRNVHKTTLLSLDHLPVTLDPS